MVVRTKTRKWGNSIGIIIPRKEAEKMNLKENEEVLLEMHKKESPLKELFGSLQSEETAKDLVIKARKELESKWL